MDSGQAPYSHVIFNVMGSLYGGKTATAYCALMRVALGNGKLLEEVSRGWTSAMTIQAREDGCGSRSPGCRLKVQTPGKQDTLDQNLILIEFKSDQNHISYYDLISFNAG